VPVPIARKVAIVTLGCARNEVDSEELAGVLRDENWQLVESPDGADIVLVNTCGFVTEAKRESIETVLSLKSSDGGGPAVIAVGCLAERYGQELADELPEADGVLGFDQYPRIGSALRRVLGGERPASHEPRDRRKLLPISPVDRRSIGPITGVATVLATGSDIGNAGGPAEVGVVRRLRLTPGPIAPLKIASGCDRRCAFCAIPSFRGAFLSRSPAEIRAEAEMLIGEGVRELLLVSENSTSYGRDLPGVDLMSLLRTLCAGPARETPVRLRLSYLQPNELSASLIEEMASNDRVVPYFDVSFQHASATVLRRMRRFGSSAEFIDLIGRIRAMAPGAGIRSNFIVGFPGESDADVEELLDFLAAARLDAVGVFGYSDEDGTEAFAMGDKISPSVIRHRVDQVAAFADHVAADRAEARVGERLEVLVERVGPDGAAVGRAGQQGPEDGVTELSTGGVVRVGEVVTALVRETRGVDLLATRVES